MRRLQPLLKARLHPKREIKTVINRTENGLRFFLTSGTAFFAGALSLVSQIIGLRIVSRELSASELTVASVLVCALCGLSLGALITGRIADRKRFKQPTDGAGSKQNLSLIHISEPTRPY